MSSTRQIGHGPDHLVTVGAVGYGLMGLTWKANETPDDVAFEAILTSLRSGGTFLNSGEFYGLAPNRTYANLEMLHRFFDQNPEWAVKGKCFLSVKGGIKIENGQMTGPDGSEAGLRRSVDSINEKLGGKKKMDLFQMARVDKTIEIEETIKTLKKLIDEGKFSHIGLSEVSARTIERAHAVHPISAVEVEYSPSSLDIEKNGVLATCERLRIPIIAYSPLGRGLLTGQVKSTADIPKGDFRSHFDRFQADNLTHNLKLFEEIKTIADQKACTPVQICLRWLLAQSDLIIPIPGSSRVEGVKEALDCLKVSLEERDLSKLREVIDKAEIKGGRYNEHLAAQLEG